MLHTAEVDCRNYAISGKAFFVYDLSSFELGLTTGCASRLVGSLCDRASLTAFVLADGSVPRREAILELDHTASLTVSLSEPPIHKPEMKGYSQTCREG